MKHKAKTTLLISNIFICMCIINKLEEVKYIWVQQKQQLYIHDDHKNAWGWASFRFYLNKEITWFEHNYLFMKWMHIEFCDERNKGKENRERKKEREKTENKVG